MLEFRIFKVHFFHEGKQYETRESYIVYICLENKNKRERRREKEMENVWAILQDESSSCIKIALTVFTPPLGGWEKVFHLYQRVISLFSRKMPESYKETCLDYSRPFFFYIIMNIGSHARHILSKE